MVVKNELTAEGCAPIIINKPTQHRLSRDIKEPAHMTQPSSND